MKKQYPIFALCACLLIGLLMSCGCGNKPTIKHEINPTTYDRVIGHKLYVETEFLSFSTGGYTWVKDTVKKPITVTTHGYHIQSSCAETGQVLSMTGTFAEVDSAKCAHEKFFTAQYDSLMMLVNNKCK